MLRLCWANAASEWTARELQTGVWAPYGTRPDCRAAGAPAILQVRCLVVEGRVFAGKESVAMRYVFSRLFGSGFLLAACAIAQIHAVSGTAFAQEKAAPVADESRPADDEEKPKPVPLPEPVGAKRLSPRYPIWIDMKEKAVLVDGQICLREGMLEMFACTKNTKEHEAIVSADTKAYLVHTGLLALGAEPGHPVQFQPVFKPASGAEIDVSVRWKDEHGKERNARAQEWIKDIKTKKEMTYPFVFGGSAFWTDPDNGKKFYQAEGGDFVCVSNFGTAMLDLPVESSQSNDELEFEAYTEKIPPIGTAVRLVFKPKPEAKGEAAKGKGESKTKGDDGVLKSQEKKTK